jgi:hypothetical protein
VHISKIIVSIGLTFMGLTAAFGQSQPAKHGARSTSAQSAGATSTQADSSPGSAAPAPQNPPPQQPGAGSPTSGSTNGSGGNASRNKNGATSAQKPANGQTTSNLANTAAKTGSTPNPEPGGDYIPCRFTPAELDRLHAPEKSSILTDAEADTLKQTVDQAALAASAKGEISEDLAEEIIKNVNEADFKGLTLSQALAKIVLAINAARGAAKSDQRQPSSQGPADTIENTIKSLSVDKAVLDALDPYIRKLRQDLPTNKDVADLNAFALGDFIEAVNRKPFESLKSFVPAVKVALGSSNVNPVLDAARQYLSRLSRPSDVFCAMSILSGEETSRAYGHIIARNYIAVQVVVRNLNPDQEFVLHDVEFAVNTDPTGAPGRFFSGRDKVIVRALSSAQQSFDPRNLTIGIAQGVGALFSAVAAFQGGNIVEASGVVNGAALPWLQTVWKDQSADQLNLLNDTGFSSTVTSQTRVPQLGTVMVVTFIPAKQFSEAWWVQPCTKYIYLGSRQRKYWTGPGKLKFYSPDGEEQEVGRALEACGAIKEVSGLSANESADLTADHTGSYWSKLKNGVLLKHGEGSPTFLTLPATPEFEISSVARGTDQKTSDLTLRDLPERSDDTSVLAKITSPGPNGQSLQGYYYVTFKGSLVNVNAVLNECTNNCGAITFMEETDIFRKSQSIDYWHWSGQSMQLFANLSLIVVAGTHVVDQTQLELSISQLKCPADDAGNVVFQKPLGSTLACTLTGKNLNKVQTLRLRSVKNPTDPNPVDGTVGGYSPDLTTATVTFPADALRCLADTAYTVFGISSTGAEQTTGQTLHFSNGPYARKLDPDSLDFADGKAKDLKLEGCILSGVASLKLTSTADSTKTATFKPSGASAADSISFSIDPTKLSGFGSTESAIPLSVADSSGKATQIEPTLSITDLKTANAQSSGKNGGGSAGHKPNPANHAKAPAGVGAGRGAQH